MSSGTHRAEARRDWEGVTFMRAAGILMHISSLPSPYGIGTMGRAAREFVDFLKKAGQTYWQILPVGPTSYGDSPYQSFSTFAGNPYFIDLDLLEEDGLLEKSDYAALASGADPESVDYGRLYTERYPVLRKAVSRLLAKDGAEVRAFEAEPDSFWLDDYATFMALKDAHDGASWQTWEKPVRFREREAMAAVRRRCADDIAFWKGVQYLFHRQWTALKAYANENGIRIIGDVPIYVSADSVDVWASPKEFQLDENLLPTGVAGCPPDYFSADGQLWGNPLFDWENMRRNGYAWWIRRMKHVTSIYDVVRIDHFRGFAGYYDIPAGDRTARNGRWRKGPGIAFFREVEKQLGDVDLIAEDLGLLDDDVRKLLAETGYPGMKVLQFAFDTEDGGGYLPHDHERHSVAYVGTHDNDTAAGWFRSETAAAQNRACTYLGLHETEGISWGMMRGVWGSPADTAIVTAQDLLGLGSAARMNQPSTTGGNWKWRVREGAFSDTLAARLASAMRVFGRLPAEKSGKTEKGTE